MKFSNKNFFGKSDQQISCGFIGEILDGKLQYQVPLKTETQVLAHTQLTAPQKN